MAKLLIAAPIGIAVIVLLYRGLVRLERSESRVAIVTIVFGLVILEAILYSQNDTPFGPFHPQVGSQNFRLYDVLIPMALIARLRVRGRPERLGGSGFIWLGFFAWYTVLAVVGKLNGNSFTNITFEYKLLIYLGGSMLLVSGFTVKELLGRKGPLALVKPCAVLCAIVGALGAAHISTNIPVPGIDVVGLEGVEADAASVLIILAVLAFVIETCRPRPNPKQMVACGVIAVSTLTSGQRAALIQLVVSLGIVAVAWLIPAARRRVSVTPTQVLVVIVALGAIILAPSVLGDRSPWQVRALPFGSQLEQTVGSESKAQSANERVNQLHQVEIYGPQRLVTGWGLGRTITYYATGTYEYSTIDITHDIATDLLLRGGMAALGLFVLAAGTVLVGGFRNWRDHPDRIVAAASLALSAVLVGLLGKGLVESIFEKYRVAVGLGLAFGLARAMLTAPRVVLLEAEQAPPVVSDGERPSA